MTEPMTDERLAEIEGLLNAITPGPWRRGKGKGYSIVVGNSSHVYRALWRTLFVSNPDFPKNDAERIANVTFSAHAPTIIRNLLNEVKRLRK